MESSGIKKALPVCETPDDNVPCKRCHRWVLRHSAFGFLQSHITRHMKHQCHGKSYCETSDLQLNDTTVTLRYSLQPKLLLTQWRFYPAQWQCTTALGPYSERKHVGPQVSQAPQTQVHLSGTRQGLMGKELAGS